MESSQKAKIGSIYKKILGHRGVKSKAAAGNLRAVRTMLYFAKAMYARKFQAEIIIDGAACRPVPLDWLDSFCMRNFTGSAEFDDTLPLADGKLEAGSTVDPARLAAAMSEWFTRRGKGNGKPVTISLSQMAESQDSSDPRT